MLHFFGWVFSLVGLVVTVAAGIFAFGVAREYVRKRLRFVDAVRHPMAPWIAALLATVVLIPGGRSAQRGASGRHGDGADRWRGDRPGDSQRRQGAQARRIGAALACQA